jgi:hypothetical protein
MYPILRLRLKVPKRPEFSPGTKAQSEAWNAELERVDEDYLSVTRVPGMARFCQVQVLTKPF